MDYRLYNNYSEVSPMLQVNDSWVLCCDLLEASLGPLCFAVIVYFALGFCLVIHYYTQLRPDNARLPTDL